MSNRDGDGLWIGSGAAKVFAFEGEDEGALLDVEILGLVPIQLSELDILGLAEDKLRRRCLPWFHQSTNEGQWVPTSASDTVDVYYFPNQGVHGHRRDLCALSP